MQERQHAALNAQRERQAKELRALQQQVSRLQHDHKQSLLQAQSQSTQVGLLTNQSQSTQVGLLTAQVNVVVELEEEQKTGSTLDWLTI